jgi:hypothetical protein
MRSRQQMGQRVTLRMLEGTVITAGSALVADLRW